MRDRAQPRTFGAARAVMGAMRRSGPGFIQGAYYTVTGLWPVVSYRSFEAITGRKREPWLVKSMGVMLVVVALALAGDPTGRQPVTRRLGIGTAAVLAAVDIWYAGVRRRIAPIYLAEAVAELGLVGLWYRSARAADRDATRLTQQPDEGPTPNGAELGERRIGR